MPRALPLPADQRRTALIAATEPLLEHFGRDVSTRQIAEAAGVAEGTIFRVFPTKEALVDAVCEQVFDVDRTCNELDRIDPALGLSERLTEAVAVLQDRHRRVFRLFHALRMDRTAPHDRESYLAKHHRDNVHLNQALGRLLEPERQALRMDSPQAGNVVRMVTLALTHPMLSDPDVYEPGEIVDLVLHGISEVPTGCDLTPSTGHAPC